MEKLGGKIMFKNKFDKKVELLNSLVALRDSKSEGLTNGMIDDYIRNIVIDLAVTLKINK